jgi:adenylate cyclase
MLNRYLGAMTDIILAHEGTIDEFLGDAILAVFGAPRHHDDDPGRAARCALAMQAAMAEINAANRSEGLPELRMGIALNTGT